MTEVTKPKLNLKIFFYQRPHHRQRQRETVLNCPSPLIALAPDTIHFVKDTLAMLRPTLWRVRLKQFLLSNLFPLALRRPTGKKVDQSDLIYTWGVIPISKKPYIIELDNPYVLTMYQVGWFRLLRPIIRRLLSRDRCRGIVCISEACKRNTEQELGPEIGAKISVVYPFIKTGQRSSAEYNSDVVTFLYIATTFYSKGGRETLRAFSKLSGEYPNARLIMVTNLPQELKDEAHAIQGLSIVKADIPKHELLETYLSRASVFILPTYFDSFGMVYLEALSYGLPIIGGDLYNVREMVVSDKNGYLVEPGIRYFDHNDMAVRKYWRQDLTQIVRRMDLAHVEEEIFKCMKNMMNPVHRKQFSETSQMLFQQKFADIVWRQSFLNAVTKR